MRNLVALRLRVHPAASGRAESNDRPRSNVKWSTLAASSLICMALSGAVACAEPQFRDIGTNDGVYSTLLRYGEHDRAGSAGAQQPGFHGGVYRNDAFSAA
jgi:hypothetical protein